MRDLWQTFEGRAGHAAARHARAALRSFALPATVDGDVSPVVEQLATEQDAWGMDVAVVRLPSELSPRQRLEGIALLATRVRPRLQGSALPDELVASWSPPPPTDSEGVHP